MGGTAASVAGNMAFHGAGQLITGQKPNARDLFMTPANAAKLTRQLSQMRGAAMKMGQMLSMEAADIMPAEVAAILARLRDNADVMPPQQLKKALTVGLGPGFMKRFRRFDIRPIAAASIGQVHRAQTLDGHDIVLKVQYPGIRDSIDSDVRNLGALLKMSSMMPDGLDLSPLLKEARQQLHDEADYRKEAAFLARYGALMDGQAQFAVPALHEEFLSETILGMQFLEGVAIDSVTSADQSTRDQVATELIRLTMRELFEFGLMQTDPNFANYRFDPENQRIILLDFGAVRVFQADMAEKYRALLRAGLDKDQNAARQAFLDIGLYDHAIPGKIEDVLMTLFEMAMAPLRQDRAYDFGNTTLLEELRQAGLDMTEDRRYVPVPPIDSLYLQRKVGGMYLLATRLKARVNLHALVQPWK